MKAKEFNKSEPTFFNIESTALKECENSNIDFYNYLGSFVRFKLFNYAKKKALIDTIKTIDFRDRIAVRAVLNKSNIFSKDSELKEAQKDFKKTQIDLFNWLDKTKKPYYFILNPVYEYGAGISYKSRLSNNHGYKKINHTGLDNLDIAIDYAKYKIKL